MTEFTGDNFTTLLDCIRDLSKKVSDIEDRRLPNLINEVAGLSEHVESFAKRIDKSGIAFRELRNEIRAQLAGADASGEQKPQQATMNLKG